MFNYLIFILVLFLNLNVFSEDIDEKIKDFLLNNPEIILQSLENYESAANYDYLQQLTRNVFRSTPALLP